MIVRVRLEICMDGIVLVPYKFSIFKLGTVATLKVFIDDTLEELSQIANNPFRSIFYWKNHPNPKMSRFSKIRVLVFKDLERIPLYGKKYKFTKPFKISAFIRPFGKKAP